jgi:hypothetical protein
VKIQILQEAKEELAGAIQYYEDITPGLGIRLKRQVKEVLSWIKVNSELPRLRTKGYRRVNCKTFPYYIAYSPQKRNIHRCNCKQLQVSGFLDRKNEVISPDRI